MRHHILWKTIKYLLPYRLVIGITWILSVVILILQGITIWVGADFIQGILSNGNTIKTTTQNIGFITQLMNRLSKYILYSDSIYNTLINAVLVLLITGVLVCIFRAIKLCIFARINQNILMQIRGELFTHITKLNLSFSNKYRHGEVSSLVIQDVNQLNFLFVDVTDRIFMQPARLLVGIILMASLSPTLTLWLFSCLLPTAIIIHILGKKVQYLSKQTMNKVALLQGKLTEYLSTVILSRSLSREHCEINSFNTEADKLRKSYEHLMFMDAFAPQIVKILTIIAGCIVIYIGGANVFIHKTMDGNTLMKMVLLLPMVAYPLEALAKLYVSVRNSLGSAERIFSLLEDNSYIDNTGDLHPPQTIANTIEFKNVSYTPDGIKVLQNLNFVIPAKSIFSIQGNSGSGKTTILSLLSKLAVVSKGQIFIDGIELHDICSNEWRKKIGIITQDSVLLNASIRENLNYANPSATDTDMIEALTKVGLWDLSQPMQNGLDTQVGNRGGIVSGGERQRLNIARVLLTNPDIYLIDEPTANLDYENRVGIKEVIKEITKGKTTIIVTHDDYLSDIADSSIQIDNGEIISGE